MLDVCTLFCTILDILASGRLVNSMLVRYAVHYWCANAYYNL